MGGFDPNARLNSGLSSVGINLYSVYLKPAHLKDMSAHLKILAHLRNDGHNGIGVYPPFLHGFLITALYNDCTTGSTSRVWNEYTI